jgi:hypothetical protein
MRTGKINLSDCYPKSIFNITYACSIKRRQFFRKQCMYNYGKRTGQIFDGV